MPKNQELSFKGIHYFTRTMVRHTDLKNFGKIDLTSDGKNKPKKIGSNGMYVDDFSKCVFLQIMSFIFLIKTVEKS